MKTSNTKSVESRKGRVRIKSGSRARYDRSEIDGGEVNNIKIEDNKVRKKVQKTSKSKNSSKSKKMVGSLNFLILEAKLAFTELRQAFLKVAILHHFDPKCYIRIETDALVYAIDGVFSQLILDNLGQ